MLFDQKSRNYMGPGKYSESYYEYIDRSARKACEHIRLLLNDWLSHFPTEHQNNLETRFRSTDDDFGFLSAFVELYIHELLLRLGFEVEIHPEIKEISTRPDFVVKLNGKPIFILEGTMSIGSHDELVAEKLKKELYDKVNMINCPNFFITPTVHGKSNKSPPVGKWCRFIERKLSELDPDEIEAREKKEGPGALPGCLMKHEGLHVSILINPRPAEMRGRKDIRNIPFRIEKSEAREAEVYIQKAVNKKATKYGKLNLPYVIAINVMHHFCFDDSIVKALFGESRNSKGAWFGPGGPRNTRVSAVLILKQLFPWSIAQNTPVLWHNPWAKIPLNPDILQLAQNIFKFEAILKEHKLGKSAVEIFNLSSNWPRMK